MKHLLLFLLVLFAPHLHAQGTVTFLANHLTQSGGGAALPDGSALCVMTVDSQNRPAGYRIGTGGGQTAASTGQEECHATIVGAVAPFSAINSATSSPANACLRVTLRDPNGVSIRQDPCVQTGTADAIASGFCTSAGGVVTCTYDNYPRGTAPNPLTIAGLPGPQGLTGCILGSNCTSDLNPRSLNGYEVHAQQYNANGTTGDAQIAAVQALYPNAPLHIIVDGPSTIAGPVTLLSRNSLEFRGNPTFNAAGYITAAGNNAISCAPGVALTTNTAGISLIQAAGDRVDVYCDGTGTQGRGGFVLNMEGHNYGFLHSGHFTLIGGATFPGGTGHMFGDLVFSAPNPGGGQYGITILGDATHIVGGRIIATNYDDPLEWFNADANFNNGGPKSRADVLKHGGWYTFAGVDCTNAVACAWGSVAHDIIVGESHAYNTADVAFDCEGCVDWTFVNAHGKEAQNGLGTAFFYSDNGQFINPDFSSATGKPLISVYNSSQDPTMNTGMKVLGGYLHCEGVPCGALGGDAQTGVVVEGVQIKNGYLATRNYEGQWTIRNTHWTADVSMNPFIQLGGVKALGPIVVDHNLFESSYTQAANTPCTSITNADFNAPVAVQFTDNRCQSGFTQDYSFTSGSGNAGIGMFLTLDGNWEHAGGVVLNSFGSRDQVTPNYSRMKLSNGVYVRATQ